MPSKPPLQWSKAMEDLFEEHVTNKVRSDNRTDWDENIRLGYPFNVIRQDVIKKGRADFREGHEHEKHGSLTAEDKVLLYCFSNMKQHFFEAVATFRAYRRKLKALFTPDKPTFMVDLGCGPGTAVLALAECFKQPTVRYAGLDISKAMQNKARSMFAAAKEGSLLGAQSRISTTSSWDTLTKFPSGFEMPVNVFINATYLFASDSLNVDDVCNVVDAFRESQFVERLLFVYLNTDTTVSGEKYDQFKKSMRGKFRARRLRTRKVTYNKTRWSNFTSSATFVRQLLDFKGAE